MFFEVVVLWDVLLGRIEQARRSDRGASALEWAIIAAVSVIIAAIIGAVIYNIVDKKGGDIQKCANLPAGKTCANNGGQ